MQWLVTGETVFLGAKYFTRVEKFLSLLVKRKGKSFFKEKEY